MQMYFPDCIEMETRKQLAAISEFTRSGLNSWRRDGGAGGQWQTDLVNLMGLCVFSVLY